MNYRCPECGFETESEFEFLSYNISEEEKISTGNICVRCFIEHIKKVIPQMELIRVKKLIGYKNLDELRASIEDE